MQLGWPEACGKNSGWLTGSGSRAGGGARARRGSCGGKSGGGRGQSQAQGRTLGLMGEGGLTRVGLHQFARLCCLRRDRQGQFRPEKRGGSRERHHRPCWWEGASPPRASRGRSQSGQHPQPELINQDECQHDAGARRRRGLSCLRLGGASQTCGARRRPSRAAKDQTRADSSETRSLLVSISSVVSINSQTGRTISFVAYFGVGERDEDPVSAILFGRERAHTR